MVLDLREAFATEGYRSSVEYKLDLSDVSFSGTYPLTQPVQVVALLSNKAGVLLLRIQCTARYLAPCDRCGEESAELIPVDIEHILATEIQNEDNCNIIPVTENKLNLDELCRADVLLQIPMKHLCSPTCKGLCPGCGKNLNKEACCCKNTVVDERLSALADLLK